MQGRIVRFFHDRGFGFISSNEAEKDVFFHKLDVCDDMLMIAGDVPVSFDIIYEDNGNLKATNVKGNGSDVAPAKFTPHGKPGHWLSHWANISHVPRLKSGKLQKGKLRLLADCALKEQWRFGTADDNQDASELDLLDDYDRYPILHNYLRYTFVRLTHQKQKITEKFHDNAQWATFNTGLVSNLYVPIYALFARRTISSYQPWSLYDFCVPGVGPSGKQLTSIFNPLPEPATYMAELKDLLFDVNQDTHLETDHIIDDGILRNRFPKEFIRRNLPDGVLWKDINDLSDNNRGEYLRLITEAVKLDDQCKRGILNRVQDAMAVAYKRTRWNFKTAIPSYYPKHDTMSLLLPLALVNDNQVDIALVVTKNPSGSYQGRTVLTLQMAYENARLVCRPDSEWLKPTKIISNPTSEDLDDES